MAATIVEVEWQQAPEEAVTVHEQLWRDYFKDAIDVGCNHEDATVFADFMAPVTG